MHVDQVRPSPQLVHGVRSLALQRYCAEGFRRRFGEGQEEADGRRLRDKVELSDRVSAGPHIAMAVMEPCNIVLCVHSGVEIADLSVVTDNTHLNRWLAQIMYPLTASLRVDGALCVDVAESQTIWFPTRGFSSCVAATYRSSQRRRSTSYNCLRPKTSRPY